ncbi:MAG: RDD family protein [Chloroflexi bacterium]|nr:RDD family protein [Chloroflexota bacterium]
MRDESLSVERASYTRRIFGSYLLEQLLFWVTLIVGWFIWLAFTAPRGRSPAKSLTSLYVINIETGRTASGGEMWLREFALKGLTMFLIGYMIPFLFLADAFWMFFDRDRQTLHDKILKQIVVYAPAGLPESMRPQPGAPRKYAAVYAWPWQSTSAAASAPARVTDVAADLRELTRLKDEGLITAEEFEEKRAALVEKM